MSLLGNLVCLVDSVLISNHVWEICMRAMQTGSVCVSGMEACTSSEGHYAYPEGVHVS